MTCRQGGPAGGECEHGGVAQDRSGAACRTWRTQISQFCAVRWSTGSVPPMHELVWVMKGYIAGVWVLGWSRTSVNGERGSMMVSCTIF